MILLNKMVEYKTLTNESTSDSALDSEVTNLTVDNLLHCVGTAVFDSEIFITNDIVTIDVAVPSTGGDYTFTLPPGGGVSGYYLKTDGVGHTYWDQPPAVGGGGTVTSVGLSAPPFLNVTNSPVNTVGTLTLTYSGTAIPHTSGGTGLNVVGSANQVLSSNGTDIVWTTPTTYVSSVGMTVPSILSVTPSTITNSGTFTVTTASTPSGTGTVLLLQGSPTITTPTITTSLTVTNSSTATTTTANFYSPSILSGNQNQILFGLSSSTCGGLIYVNTGSTATNYISMSFIGPTNPNIFRIRPTYLELGSRISIPSDDVLKMTASTMTTTNNVSYTLGRDDSNYNTALLQFNYNSLNSATNTYGIGFFGFPNLYTFSGTALTSTLPIILNNGSFATTVSTAATSNYVFTLPINAGTSGYLLTSGGPGGTMSWTPASGLGVGSVTSVGMVVPSILSVTPSTITTSGTFTVTTASTPSGTGTVLLLQGSPTITTPTITTSLAISNGSFTTTISTAATSNSTFKLPVDSGIAGQVLTSGGTGFAMTWGNLATYVSSVAATVPAAFSITGSPITSSGTLAITYSGVAIPTTSGGTGLITIGSNTQVLTSNGTSLLWTTPTVYVSSVGMTVPSILSVTPASITTTGTFAVTTTSTPTGTGTVLVLQASPTITTPTITSSITVTSSSTANPTTANFFSPSILSGNQNQILFGLSSATAGTLIYVNTGSSATNFISIGFTGPTSPNIHRIKPTYCEIGSRVAAPSDDVLKMTANAMTVTNNVSYTIGVDDTTYNTAVLQFNYNTANSTTNTYGIGFFGALNLYKFSGTEFTSTLPIVLNNGSFTTTISSGATSNSTFKLPINAGTSGQFLSSAGSGNTMVWTSAVTSVGMTVPTILSVTPASITTTGTFAVTTTSTPTGSGTVLVLDTSPTFQTGITINASANVGLRIQNASLATASNIQFIQGVSGLSYQSAIYQFNYVGASSTANNIGLGFPSHNNLYNFSGVSASFTLPLSCATSTTTEALALTASTTASQTILSGYSSGLVAGNSIGMNIGTASTTGNSALLQFTYQGSNSSSNGIYLGFSGSGGGALQLSNIAVGEASIICQGFTGLYSSMTAATVSAIRTGKALTTGNCGEVVFTYQGANSSSSTVSLGFYGTPIIRCPNLTSGTTQIFQNILSVENSSISSSGGIVALQVGAIGTAGNMAQFYFINNGNNSASNQIKIGFQGGGGGYMTLNNSTSTNISTNVGLEHVPRGEEYFLSSNQGISTLTYTTMTNMSMFNSSGNNLLTYVGGSGTWANNTGRNVMVTFTAHLHINGNTGAAQIYIQKNVGGSSYQYGVQDSSSNNMISTSATILLATATTDSVSIIVYGASGVGLNIEGGASNTKNVAHVSYVIH